jgi:hypothetical protein
MLNIVVTIEPEVTFTVTVTVTLIEDMWGDYLTDGGSYSTGYPSSSPAPTAAGGYYYRN